MSCRCALATGSAISQRPVHYVHGSRRKGLSIGREILKNESVVGQMAGPGAVRAKVMILAVERNNRLSARSMLAVFWIGSY